MKKPRPQDKVIKLLVMLRGDATTEQIRKKAAKKFPTKTYNWVGRDLRILQKQGFLIKDNDYWKFAPHTAEHSHLEKMVDKRNAKINQDNIKRYDMAQEQLDKLAEAATDQQDSPLAGKEIRDVHVPLVRTTTQLTEEKEERKRESFKEFLDSQKLPPPKDISFENIPPEISASTNHLIEDSFLQSEKTIGQAINEAIKKPYLDDLKDLADNIEIKATKYRGRYELVQDILQNLEQRPLKPTSLMYKSNMSFSQFKRYIQIVINNGLVEIIPNGYQITPKGREALGKMLEIKLLF